MKTDDLDAFVAVVRCQSLSVAADALKLTQSAITRRVQNFEEALGAELLDRHTKPLKPTAMGLRVYEQCREVQRALDALRALVEREAAPSGSLRLGVPQTLSDLVLLDALQQLQDRYPQLHIQVSNGWGNTLLSRLESLELDAVAALFPPGKRFPDSLAATSLARIRLVVVAAHDNARRRTCKLAECSSQGWVLNPDGCGFRAGLQHALLEQGQPLQINLETFGSELQLGLVARGRGLGLVPEPLLLASRYRDQLEVLNVSDFKPVVDLWLIHPRFVGNLHAAIASFGELVASTLNAAPPT